MDGDATGLQRSGMADVLEALVCEDCHNKGPLMLDGPPCPTCDGTAWISDVHEAVETLQTRGLAPPYDDWRAFAVVTRAGSLPRTERHLDAPGTILDLVAWVSLGPAAILRAEG